MWAIQYTNIDGEVIKGKYEYSKQSTAELAAAWFQKKQNINWIAVEVKNGEENT